MSIILQIKVSPNASKNQIIGWEGNLLRVKIKGVPQNGKVNRELIEFLGEKFGIAKSNIKILSGQTSRLKRFEIRGLTQLPLDLS